jgi:hypothetical protein
MVGMTKYSQPSVPEGGSRGSQTLSKTMSISPSQKLGMACPMTERKRAVRSIQLLGRMAAITPSGMEKTRAKTMAEKPRIKVAGRRAAMIWLTGTRK